MQVDINQKFDKKILQDTNAFDAILHSLQPIKQKHEKEADEIKKIILNELNNNELNYTSLENVLQTKKDVSAYKEALPILIKWFIKTDNPIIKESLARELTVSFANPSALKPLIKQFKKLPDNWIWHNAKWAIGNALEVTSDDSIFEDLVQSVKNPENGYSREMVVLALGKMKNPNIKDKASDVLIDLLNDDEVVGHAIIGLRKLNAVKAKDEIEKFKNYPTAWVRDEAKKTIAKFEKLENEQSK